MRVPARDRGAALGLAALALAGCRALPPGAECWSLDGRALVPPAAEPAVQAQREADLAAAVARHRAAPHDRDAAIWVARRLGYLGRYRAAIAVLDDALQRHPGDPFVLRHRGHRWLTLREFARAERDLRAAADACRHVADAVEPDGQPVAGRPPHSSLHYNVHYHLGLARFLLGDWPGADAAWEQCLAVATNDESRVAATHWSWCARMRRGDRARAAAAVASIHARMDVVENVAYWRLCRLYTGQLARAELAPAAAGAAAGNAGRGSSSDSALAFGLAHFDFVTGDRAVAIAALRELAASPAWAAFGVLAAEAELARNGTSPR